MICPRCEGTGKLFPGIPIGSPFDDISCVRCLGTGEVPREMLEWMLKGDKLKGRIRELKMYGEEVEEATKIDSSTLYKISDGLIKYPDKPNPMNVLNRWIKDQAKLGLWPPKGWEQRI